MEKGRLEAFTDGVIAVIITIMVLELKPPQEPSFPALMQHWPIFLSYVLSFIYVGIYWNNHHHMFHAVEHVNGRVMWANLFFLFWLSLFPFATSWLDESHWESTPTAFYGFVLLMAALSWIPLSRALIAINGGSGGQLAQAIGGNGGDWKANVSPFIYIAAIVLAVFAPNVSFGPIKSFWPVVSCGLYAIVAAIWFIPDKRIEKKVLEDKVSSQ
jgi:uncharacterized membrane protein